MIGNDIIDIALTKTESNWKRKGLFDKIFTESEKLLISESENPEILVWSFWSQKEAAYKIFNRQTKIRSFNPLQFKCNCIASFEGIHSGKVIFKDTIYHILTEINVEFVHTIAVADEENLQKTYELQSDENITKEVGIPLFTNPHNGQIKPVSISHHGRFRKVVTF